MKIFQKKSVTVPVEKRKENLYKVIVASLPKHISFKLPRNGRSPLESVFSSLNFKQNCRKKPFYTVSNVSLKHSWRVSTKKCSLQFSFKENILVEVNTLPWGDNSRAKPTSCWCRRKGQKSRFKSFPLNLCGETFAKKTIGESCKRDTRTNPLFKILSP